LVLLIAGSGPATHRPLSQAPLRTAAPPKPFFEANRGQAGDEVKFISRGKGFTLLLTANEAVLSPRGGTGADALRLRLVGGRSEPHAAGIEELPGKVNYLLGNDPRSWRTGVPTYGKVRYEEVYPGVDLVYHTDQQAMEYDFIVAPAADPRLIRLAFGGAREARIDERGDLVLSAPFGELRQRRPVAYQELDGVRREVAAEYEIGADGDVGFRVAAYDASQALVIDPVMTYSTHLGGSSGELAFGLAVDGTGNVYVGGSTGSSDFPTTAGGFDTSFNGPAAVLAEADAVVTKLAPDGASLVYSTYLGGSGADWIHDLEIDAVGNVYVTGVTASSDFPTTPGAFDTSLGGQFDGFVAKLASDGASLVFSTFFGGGLEDAGRQLELDAAGVVHLAGSTSSADFPVTAGVFDTSFNGDGFSGDSFVAGLSADGGSLLYASYLGGFRHDEVWGHDLDAEGNIYVTGPTESTDYPTTPGAFDASYNGGACDAFVTKLTPGATSLAYSTYLGGPGCDYARSLAVDAQGNVVVAGQTDLPGFPTTAGAFDTSHNSPGREDFFVSKLDANGAALVYSTYLGGNGWDYGAFLYLADDGSVYLTGRASSSTTLPTTPDAFDRRADRWDELYVARLDAAGSQLLYGTYLGGNEDEGGFAVTGDASGAVYVLGETRSLDFPTTTGTFDRTLDGFSDLVVVKLSPPSPCTLEVTPSFTGGILHLGFVLGTGTAADLRWSASVRSSAGFQRLWSTTLPVIDPPSTLDVPVPEVGDVGWIWIVTRLTTRRGRIVCSDRAVFDTSD
jgi:hypothetical protein